DEIDQRLAAEVRVPDQVHHVAVFPRSGTPPRGGHMHIEVAFLRRRSQQRTEVVLAAERDARHGMALQVRHVTPTKIGQKCTIKREERVRRVSIDLRHSETEFTEFYSLRVC